MSVQEEGDRRSTGSAIGRRRTRPWRGRTAWHRDSRERAAEAARKRPAGIEFPRQYSTRRSKSSLISACACVAYGGYELSRFAPELFPPRQAVPPRPAVIEGVKTDHGTRELPRMPLRLKSVAALFLLPPSGGKKQRPAVLASPARGRIGWESRSRPDCPATRCITMVSTSAARAAP
jgi:hypothetical protein